MNLPRVVNAQGGSLMLQHLSLFRGCTLRMHAAQRFSFWLEMRCLLPSDKESYNTQRLRESIIAEFLPLWGSVITDNDLPMSDILFFKDSICVGIIENLGIPPVWDCYEQTQPPPHPTHA